MAPANTRLRRFAVAGGLAVAALALPALAAVGGTGTPQTSAEGQCLAWFGSRGDGICMGYSNGNPTYIGTPYLGVFGPGYGNGLGITTGPLLPGQTITEGLSP
ncbi:MAG: hypothetical protein KDB47_11180 [Mycobacterium sp.]|nr:hypothetical protein [Mycobacterium sp.]